MSIGAVNEFREKIGADNAIEAAVRGMLGEDGVIDLAGVVALGKQHGYAFTENDIVTVFDSDDTELSEFELEMVSAGIQTQGSLGL